MPFRLFDRSQLNIKPLAERTHIITINDFIGLEDEIEPFNDPAILPLAKKIVAAKEKGATVLLMYGAHVIRAGCGPHMIEMMKRGEITHLATNGAGSIHDFELSLIGETSESVENYIKEGQFGLWRETGIINDIIIQGCKDNLGWGEAVGRYIWENNLPNRERSVLAMGYKLGIPCTVHVGIGSDIIHEHPNCDGAAMGTASYTDFLIYTQSVTNLENGVFLNFGSAVTGPEVYLKALAMARNVAIQSEKQIRHFTTAVFDVQPLGEGKPCQTPEKSNPRYYFRPWKTILARTVADGGESYYIQGEHRLTLPHLARQVWAL
ncbi:MAG: hypothetical protein LBD23_02395 [Oscillospiraceae bacterium]|jgi:hypothetical protein|nr:hypothetical protein [Oscillospiraceae bacterium]